MGTLGAGRNPENLRREGWSAERSEPSWPKTHSTLLMIDEIAGFGGVEQKSRQGLPGLIRHGYGNNGFFPENLKLFFRKSA